ncbi:MAG: argininosuccinate lyase [Candidatus Omnitrophota bacterium]|nr:MAG: argininosuccinate lyase [Candidatus Omnitrophota bacterium]HDN86578.1 argininosuccinate lyase [Candidatus Omnitrophota bacterium]
MSNKLWGGRFKKDIDKDFFEFQKSIGFDHRLAEYDLYHSLIHIRVLRKAKILSSGEFQELDKALRGILREVKSGKFKFDPQAEDIHTDIQNRIEKKTKAAKKLHTLRSRNDQIVFDEKCYCYREAVSIKNLLSKLLDSLITLINKYKGFFMVGYTHTRRAQIVLFKDYLGAFYTMFVQDGERIVNFLKRLKIFIGAGALAGTSLEGKYYQEAVKEVFGASPLAKKIMPPINSLESVSDRDFVIEFLSIISLIQLHLSRLASDFILYGGEEFSFFELPESFCTGSSLLPHKKNPDFLELVRGLTGKVYSNLVSVLVMMKGLPLTYNRDMQLNKESLFSSVDTIKEELKIMSKFMPKIKLSRTKINQILEDESLYATEIAQFLVYKGVPFKEAHHVVGKLISYSQRKKLKIKDMPNELIKSFHSKLNQKELIKIMTPEYVVSSRKSTSRKFSTPKL